VFPVSYELNFIYYLEEIKSLKVSDSFLVYPSILSRLSFPDIPARMVRAFLVLPMCAAYHPHLIVFSIFFFCPE
jgi:hypothetical protein